MVSQWTVFQRVSLQEDIRGHEEAFQEPQLQMWVPAWPACGSFKCPETEVTVMSARRELVQQNYTSVDPSPNSILIGCVVIGIYVPVAYPSFFFF